jgi:hypothetical protein
MKFIVHYKKLSTFAYIVLPDDRRWIHNTIINRNNLQKMYSERLKGLIDAALADGELTEKEKQILLRRAEAEGIDRDEIEMVLDARLYNLKKASDTTRQIQTPKSNKFGDMCKCPACGAIVTSGTAKCQECGYAFSNIEANRTVERLYEELQRIGSSTRSKTPESLKELFTAALTVGEPDESTKKKMAVISNFPIPNTRADLIDTLSSIQGKVDSKASKKGLNNFNEEELGYAYWLMYTNCINKARISFSDDKAFQPYFDFYEKELARSKKKRFGWF